MAAQTITHRYFTYCVVLLSVNEENSMKMNCFPEVGIGAIVCKVQLPCRQQMETKTHGLPCNYPFVPGRNPNKRTTAQLATSEQSLHI